MSEEVARREAVVEAAFAELVTRGYEKTTMLGIAKRAGASKETLYSWFGNKEGLFATLIQHQAETTVEQVKAALEQALNLRATLEAFALGLLTLLLGEPSLSLNRAAMAAPTLAPLLLRYGRYTAGPMVEKYLERSSQRGELDISCTQTAFQTLYGLVIQDWQIRVLLGEDPPLADELAHHAAAAVEQFLQLYAPTLGKA